MAELPAEFAGLSNEEILATLAQRRKELAQLNTLASEKGISKNAVRKNGSLVRAAETIGRNERLIAEARTRLDEGIQRRDDLVANYLRSKNVEELPAEIVAEMTAAYEAAKAGPPAKTKDTTEGDEAAPAEETAPTEE